MTRVNRLLISLLLEIKLTLAYCPIVYSVVLFFNVSRPVCRVVMLRSISGVDAENFGGEGPSNPWSS